MADYSAKQIVSKCQLLFVEERDKKVLRHAEVSERETEELKKSRNKAKVVKLCCPLAVF